MFIVPVEPLRRREVCHAAYGEAFVEYEELRLRSRNQAKMISPLHAHISYLHRNIVTSCPA